MDRRAACKRAVDVGAERREVVWSGARRAFRCVQLAVCVSISCFGHKGQRQLKCVVCEHAFWEVSTVPSPVQLPDRGRRAGKELEENEAAGFHHPAPFVLWSVVWLAQEPAVGESHMPCGGHRQAGGRIGVYCWWLNAARSSRKS